MARVAPVTGVVAFAVVAVTFAVDLVRVTLEIAVREEYEMKNASFLTVEHSHLLARLTSG